MNIVQGEKYLWQLPENNNELNLTLAAASNLSFPIVQTLVSRGFVTKELLNDLKDTEVRIPLTQAVVYGWYDNEMGNYVTMLGELTQLVAES